MTTTSKFTSYVYKDLDNKPFFKKFDSEFLIQHLVYELEVVSKQCPGFYVLVIVHNTKEEVKELLVLDTTYLKQI